ncbi:putative sulfate exporter family transporter [Aldersonia sp. NBC_00410]|uniref:YeiH family protein n=1 Tax=Aldersonia sp. NBC_00410 TaxID=2975954 RepID=UPI00225AC5EE|nr:putative sulfate exporter family transporter [Aldersonia sp. NBC_00410]MCX5042062.1 putative sulfate exporter family transporter [Aldersonia sp. NBC_00410]
MTTAPEDTAVAVPDADRRVGATRTLGGLRTAVPGLALCAIATAAAFVLARLLGGTSPMLIAILLGAVLANLVPPPATFEPGIAVASRRLLRIGVALLGLQLLLPAVLALGWGTLAVVVAVVVGGIAGTLAIGKLLGLDWPQRILIACSFSICGAAAAAAIDGVVSARKKDLVTTVALVVVFGTAMIPLLPAAASLLGLDPEQGGMWAGAAIHEVAQVVAAGGTLDTAAAAGGGVLAIAVTVKLARVALLAPVSAWVAVAARRRSDAPVSAQRPPIVPLFLVGFMACVAVRTTGILGPNALDFARTIQTLLLTAAMFALGTGVRIAVLRGLGWRPIVLAASATALVTGISFAGVLIVG